MINEIVQLHRRALPHTWSSRQGETFVSWLYGAVGRLGYVRTIEREGEVVGAISGIGAWILTLIVDPGWQRQGIGRTLLADTPGRRYVYTEESNLGFYQKMGFTRLFKLGKLTILCRK